MRKLNVFYTVANDFKNVCQKWRMPSKRIVPKSRLSLSQSSKRNVESCPNSFLCGYESKDKDKDIFKNKRNRILESSPLLETCQEDKQLLGDIDNLPRLPSAGNTPDGILQLKENKIGSFNENKRSSNENPLQQYTLMTYSSGPMVSSLYPNYNTSGPFVSQYSSYSWQNISKMNRSAPCFNKSDCSNYIILQNGQTFPSFFNPRTASNMPHKEKVNTWIDNIPVYENEDGHLKSQCFNAEYSLGWEDDEFDSCEVNGSATISFCMNDDLLFLQSKKIETLVRKLYELENGQKQNDEDLSVDSNSLRDYI